jgi:hypothetical protein
MKTQKTKSSVADFLNGIADKQQRADCKAIAKMMREVTGKNAKMWGTSIVGFGTYDYKYASGREGSFFLCGFSPRARNLAIYVMSGFSEHKSLMARLGKHSTGKSCLYVKKLDDLNPKVLKSLTERSVKYMRKTYTTY